jgi:hypothetical protein
MVSLEALQEKLGKELVNSPFLSVMIVNRQFEVVWHNQRFADEFNQGGESTGVPCFQAAGFGEVHANCRCRGALRRESPIWAVLSLKSTLSSI